jgi:glycosyltransferase involved in cell wall biosynthesis
MNRISAVLVIYNEEKVIKRCLESIKGLADEIIVIHDGKCEDRSLEICKKYTDKIYTRKHIGEAEGHRIFSFEKTSYEWILQIDADEYINKNEHTKIRRLIENKNINGYAFLWKLWDGEKYITKYSPHKTCLVKKSEMKFIASPHEMINLKNGKTKNVNITLEHKPQYDNFTLKVFKSKWLKWAKIQAKTLSKDFDKVEKIGYSKTIHKWPFPKEIRRSFPLIFIPIDISNIVYSMCLEFRKDISFKIFKVILLNIYYVIFLDIYIWKYKKLKINGKED